MVIENFVVTSVNFCGGVEIIGFCVSSSLFNGATADYVESGVRRENNGLGDFAGDLGAP